MTFQGYVAAQGPNHVKNCEGASDQVHSLHLMLTQHAVPKFAVPDEQLVVEDKGFTKVEHRQCLAMLDVLNLLKTKVSQRQNPDNAWPCWTSNLSLKTCSTEVEHRQCLAMLVAATTDAAAATQASQPSLRSDKLLESMVYA